MREHASMRRWNTAQRTVVAVAVGVVAAAVAHSVVTELRSCDGWFGYAPNTEAVFTPRCGRSSDLVLAWGVAAACWAAFSLWLFRTLPPTYKRMAGSERQPDESSNPQAEE